MGEEVGMGFLQFFFRTETPSTSNHRQACIAGGGYVHEGVADVPCGLRVER